MGSIHLVEDRDQWKTLVNMVMNLGTSKIVCKFLSSWATGGFSRTQLHGVSSDTQQGKEYTITGWAVSYSNNAVILFSGVVNLNSLVYSFNHERKLLWDGLNLTHTVETDLHPITGPERWISRELQLSRAIKPDTEYNWGIYMWP
jgi:hypothetical protein